MDDRDYRRQVAAGFYRVFCPDRLGELEFIDYNYPVRDVRVPAGTRLSGFKDPRVSPLRTTFFSLPGSPSAILGVHSAGTLRTNPSVQPKVLNEYEVMIDIPHALLSVCADGLDAWSEHGRVHPVGGGGWQYKVPQPARYVRYTTPFPQR